MRYYDKLIFELSREGRTGYSLRRNEWTESSASLPAALLREEAPALPQVSEVDVVRHYTNLSQMNFGVDTGFYPLGSCTMKYNPKINEEMAAMPGFQGLHPLQPADTVQGALAVYEGLDKALAAITGMARFTFAPCAGAHGELTGLMIMRRYHQLRGDVKRTKVIVPDSAHGTNPASAAVCGLEVVVVKSNADGLVDVNDLRPLLGDDIAGIMMTNPNTLGLFEKDILEIAQLVHGCGGLLYYDGANMNPLLGVVRPGDMGFDILHLNLHKTFSTPHGGGGPGSGPVGAAKHVAPFLPHPIVSRVNGVYTLQDNRPQSKNRMKSFYGNMAVVIRGYCYLRQFDAKTLRTIAENAILNANYVRACLKGKFNAFFDRTCMHECVLTPPDPHATGVHTADIAKRLLDYGFYAPTIYFPLIVPEALMVEPTETENKEMLDAFVAAMERIYEEIQTSPQEVKDAPHTQPVKRIDEVSAARNPNLRW